METHPWPRGRSRLASAATLGLLLATLGLGTPPASAAPLPLAYDPAAMEKSIVQLYIEWSGRVGYTDDKGKERWETASFAVGCSGAFVSTDAHISTAGHCVDDSDEQYLGTTLAASLLRGKGYAESEIDDLLGSMFYDDTTIVRTVYAYQNDEIVGSVLPPRGLVTEVVAFQTMEQGDNALLQVNNFSRLTPSLPVTETKLSVGDKIIAIGFPGIVTALSDGNRQRASFKSGEVSSVQTTSSGVAYVETSAVTSTGMSGGPVVNGNGEIAGSVSYGPSTREAFNFATMGLREFLVTNGVPLMATETPPPTGLQLPTPQAG